MSFANTFCRNDGTSNLIPCARTNIFILQFPKLKKSIENDHEELEKCPDGTSAVIDTLLQGMDGWNGFDFDLLELPLRTSDSYFCFVR